MGIEEVLAFNAVMLAACISPGPALIFAMYSALTSSAESALQIAVGLALGSCIWTCVAFVGLGAMFLAFPWMHFVLRILGALYLLYLAKVIWNGAAFEAASAPEIGLHPIVRGMLVNVLNPKAVLFVSAYVVVIFPPSLTNADRFILVANQFLFEGIFYAFLVLAMSFGTTKARYLKARRCLDKCAAGVLGFIGIHLVFGG